VATKKTIYKSLAGNGNSAENRCYVTPTLAETKDDEAKSGPQPPSSSQPEPNVTPAEEYFELEDRLEAENERRSGEMIWEDSELIYLKARSQTIINSRCSPKNKRVAMVAATNVYSHIWIFPEKYEVTITSAGCTRCLPLYM
jgi:hypothetical protein